MRCSFSLASASFCSSWVFFSARLHAKIANLVDGVPQLLETDIEMTLLLLKILSLLIVELDILGDKVEEVARSEERNSALLLVQAWR